MIVADRDSPDRGLQPLVEKREPAALWLSQ
jgi:hypothetical protein